MRPAPVAEVPGAHPRPTTLLRVRAWFRVRALMTGLVTALVTGLLVGPAPAGASKQRPPHVVAWVATDASVTEPGSAITPVDLTTRTVERKVSVATLPEAASLPCAFALIPGGAGVLVVSLGDDTLHEIDPSTDRVTHAVTVGLEPDAVAVAVGGPGVPDLALVANLDDNSVTPVDLTTWKAGKPIPVGTEPVAIAVAQSGPLSGTAYVADFGSNQVTPIDLATLQPGAPIAVGDEPQTLAVAGGEVLVGNFGNRSLTPIVIATGKPGAAVSLPLDPTGIAVTQSGLTAYISGGASVVPLAVNGLTIGSPTALGGVAEAIALNPGDATAWVAIQSGSIEPVTLATGRVGRAIHLGGHPSALVIAERRSG